MEDETETVECVDCDEELPQADAPRDENGDYICGPCIESRENEAYREEHRSFLHDAYIVALTDVILNEKRIEALHFVMSGIKDNYYDDKTPLGARQASMVLSAELYKAKSDAMLRVMQFGSLQGGDYQKVANRMAFQKLVEHNYAIMGLLHTGGHYLGGYRTDEQTRFKEEIRAALECSDEHDGKQCGAPEQRKEIVKLQEALRAADEREQRLREVIGAFTSEVTERLEAHGERR